jgi:hypothetical protein
MTDNEIRIAIAEACGWRDVTPNPLFTPPHCGFNDSQGKTESTNCGSKWGIPNYLNDLNAMHEAENMLTKEQQELYYKHLNFNHNRRGPIWHCTAAQRAEAFLRTLNLWKE